MTDGIVHCVSTDDERTWDDPFWLMVCGLLVRAYDDGSLDPNTDFVNSIDDPRINCQKCLEEDKRLKSLRKTKQLEKV